MPLPVRLRGALRARGEDGLTLIEVMVALFMLALVSAAAAGFLVGALRTTARQSDKQNATALATQSLEAVQAVPVTQVLLGRRQTDVQAMLALPQVAPLVAQDVVATDNYDPAASAASTAVIPVTRTQTIKGTVFTLLTAVNRCFLSPTSHTCTRAAASDGVATLRATVSVQWGLASCGTQCRFATSALLDTQLDPLFNRAKSRPIISSVSPTTVDAGTTATLTVSGKDFASGATLAVGTGGGTFSATTRDATGRSLSATWTVGTAPGDYTLALTNPDSGRAESSLLSVLPRAVNDCTNTSTTDSSGNTYYYVDLRANDIPAGQGSWNTTGTSSAGTLYSYNNGQYLLFKPNSPSTAGTYTVPYTLTVNSKTSTPATVTFQVRRSC